MKLPRRRFLHLAAGAATLSAMSRMASAQTYPSRPVRIVVGLKQNRGGYRKSKRLGGLEVHDHLKFCRHLNGQLRRLRAA